MIAQLKVTYSKPVALVYAFCAFFAVIWHFLVPSELVDTAEYINTALSWISKVEISNSPLSEMRRSPLYPALSYLQFPFTSTPGIHSLRFIQLIASLCIPPMVHQILISLRAEKYFNWVMILLISFPLQFYYTALELPDFLAQLFLLVLFKQLIQKKSTGVSVAFLIGLKPIFFYLLILPIIQFYLNHDRNRLKLTFPFLFFGGWIYYNNHNHQLATYTSMGTTNAYYYNRKLLLNQLWNSESVDSLYSAESSIIENHNHENKWVDSFMNSKTKESIINHPFKYFYIHAKGSLQTLVDPGRFDAMVFWNWPKSSGFLGVNDGNPQKMKRPLYEWIYMGIFGLLGALKSFMLFGVVVKNLLNRKLRDFASFAILCAFIGYIILLGPVGAARYLLPWYSVIAILIGVNIFELMHFFKRNENPSAQ